MSIEAQIAALGLVLPPAPRPLASYVPAIQTGNLVYCSGQLPLRDGELTVKGRVGESVSESDARDAAALCTLNALAAVKAVIGDLDRIERVVRITGYVHANSGFTGQPAVMNGASDLLVQILGERGQHSRVAIGVSSLPLDAPVEVEMIVAVST